MWNTKTGAAICDLNFITAVLAVRMNRQRCVTHSRCLCVWISRIEGLSIHMCVYYCPYRLVAVLERKIYIFDINSMKILETLDTSPNPSALCVLSPHDNGHLAFPSGASPGEIVLYDANNLSVLNAFQAHRGAPVAMAFNSQGTLLATASETGTIIRVFGVPGGKKKASFRRGSYPAQIYCLAFNESSTILCASSDTGTIHFFSLTGAESTATGSFGHFTPITSTFAVAGSTFGSTAFGGSAAAAAPQSPMATATDGRVSVVGASPSRTSRSASGTNLEDVAGAVSAYLPTSLTGMAEGTRDFAYVRRMCAVVVGIINCRFYG